MKILVVGGTGTVGSQLTGELKARGATVQVMTRSAEKAKSMPYGIEGVVGDLDHPSTLPSLFKGIDGLFLNVALDPRETEKGLAAVNAAKASQVPRIAYLSVHRVEAGAGIPHFKSKIPIEKAVRESGIPYTILRPNNFYQNDLGLRDAIMMVGIYPQPIGPMGLNRVDVRDIAEVAANALLQPGHEGQTYPLVGPESLTGEAVASTYSRLLGREIRYGGDDLDAWAQQVQKSLPAWMVHDLRLMYEHFQKYGLPASEADFAQQQKGLGHPPRRFDDFVREIAESWRS